MSFHLKDTPFVCKVRVFVVAALLEKGMLSNNREMQKLLLSCFRAANLGLWVRGGVAVARLGDFGVCLGLDGDKESPIIVRPDVHTRFAKEVLSI
jgi:hypothetical protein